MAFTREPFDGFGRNKNQKNQNFEGFTGASTTTMMHAPGAPEARYDVYEHSIADYCTGDCILVQNLGNLQ